MVNREVFGQPQENAGRVLVTDAAGIMSPEHYETLESANLEVVAAGRQLNEEELIEALQGITAYLLGGDEQVTGPVIEAAKDLRFIVLGGTNWKHYIPGWETAVENGVRIANTPGANAIAVAEWAVATSLMMQRELHGLGNHGEVLPHATGSMEGNRIGVIGAGHIGKRVIQMMNVFEPAGIAYSNRTEKPELTDAYGARYVETEQLVQQSDVLFVTVPSGAGTVLGEKEIQNMKPGALVASISPMNVVDWDALLPYLQRGELRAIADWPEPDGAFAELPSGVWYNSRAHAAFDTTISNKKVVDAAVGSIVNFVTVGEDDHEVAYSSER